MTYLLMFDTVVFISLLCIADADKFLWKGNLFLKAGRRKRETLCTLLFEFPWGEFGVSVPWPICQMLPKQWAIYLLLHLSTLKIWVVVRNKPDQNEQSKSTQWLQYTKLFVSLRASGMMHLHFVYPDHFLDAIHTWMTLNSLTS